MYDIVALGELLIDFTEHGESENGMALFERNPGGAVANVLAAAAKCGRSTAFIGKVGDDMHGCFLKSALDGAGIDTRGLVTDANTFTTLAFVAIGAGGERCFSFARKPGADTQLEPGEVNADLLRGTRIFHIGSLSLTDEPARSATCYAIGEAKRAGAIISYDPNYRASLWQGEDAARTRMRSVIPYTDVIKISDEETVLLTGESDPGRAAQKLCDSGIPCAIVTLGARGAFVCVQGKPLLVPGYSVPAVDTTGAGDAFWGGFLHSLLKTGKRPYALSLDDAEACARWGNATAALCIQKRGAIPAMPDGDAVAAFLAAPPLA